MVGAIAENRLEVWAFRPAIVIAAKVRRQSPLPEVYANLM